MRAWLPSERRQVFVALLLGVLLLLAAAQAAQGESYEQAVEGTAGLAHFWPMGEASGATTFVDVAGGATAEVSGGVTLGEPGGLVGDSSTAALFNGSTGAAHASVDLSGTHELTVEFWMKWDSYGADDRLALEFTPDFNEYSGGFLVDPDATPGSDFAVSVGRGSTANTVFFERPSAGQWHYYAFVIDTEAPAESEITPYVDGKAVSYVKGASDSGAGNFANSMLFWMSRDASTLFGAGSMQDLALYESALSAGMIARHYELGEGGPKASFTSTPLTATAGVPVHLDGSGSSSPAGTITDYAWDFNGGKEYGTDTAESPMVSHTFSAPGTYTVDLRVKDSEGLAGTTSQTITVAAALPAYERAVESTSGLAHFWPMGESSGESFADIFAGANATLTGGVTLGEAGGLSEEPGAHGALFNGSSGAAHASVNLSATHELTVEFWMEWDSYAADDHLALEFTPDFNEYSGGFLVDPDATPGSDFAVSVGKGATANTVLFERPSAGQWHYYAFVIDTEASAESEITPYVDGRAVSYTKGASDSGAGSFANSTLFWFSRDASTLFGAGSMQDFALYEGALSKSTIVHHYELGAGGPKAAFTSTPVAATAGVPVHLDASGSSSPAGPIADYAWDFDGSKTYGTDAGESASTTHTFSTAGTYTVDLRVTDGEGTTATVSHTITVAAALPAYEQAVESTSGLAHFWPMGESSGESFADVFDGANATLTGGVTLGEPGGVASDTTADGAAFNGSTGAAHASLDLSGTHELTVEFWMRWSTYGADDHLALEFTPDFNEYTGGFLVDPDATPGSDFAASIGEGSSRNTVFFERPSAGQWHYYAFVINTEAPAESEITPYVDGKAVSYTKTLSGTGAGNFADSTLYWFSRDASTLYGAGTMQDLALYEGTLSAEMIQAHYELGEGLQNTTLPSITGTAQDGQTLAASTGSWIGPKPVTYSYQWQRCDLAGAECEDIEAATSPSYAPTAADLEETLRVLVTASDVADSVQAASAASAVVEGGPPSELQAPSVAGTPAVGETLQADPGSWGGSETEIAYQWERCNAAGGECAQLPSATQPQYTLLEEDVGDTLRVRVGASNTLGALTAVSAVSPVIEASAVLVNTWAASISGVAQSGRTLSADAGSWLGSSSIGYTYQWQRCDEYGGECKDIEGAEEATYTLGSEDIAHTLRVEVAASEEEGTVFETTSTTQPVAAAGAPATEEPPVLTGTGLVGYTLTATTGAWAAGEEPLSYSFQWKRCSEAGTSCSAISGASAGTYTLTESDIASTIRVLVTATDTAGSTKALSAATAPVSAATLAEVSAPSISGVDEEGRSLSADPGIWTGAGSITFAYEWKRCNEKGESCTTITGASDETYRPTAADTGDTLKVEVSVSGTAGTATATSTATPVIASEPMAPEALLPPSIEGNLTAGDTLSAATGMWVGSEPITYTYQWQACSEEDETCTDIKEATSSTYTLTESDIADTIALILTAHNTTGSSSETVYAQETVGAAGPPANSEAPVIDGTPRVGERVFAGNGRWTGSRPLSYYYQWELCNTSGADCAAIEDATKPSYTITSGDAGSTLRIKVSTRNSLASAGALSEPKLVAAAGEASITEALEIAEATDPSILAPSTTASIESQTIQPALTDAGEEIVSSSTLASSSVSKETPGEFAVQTADGELSITPDHTPPRATKTPTIVNATAALFAETFVATDALIRPAAAGATALLQLRSAEAPTSFSWEIHVGPEQQLEKLSDGDVAITEPEPDSELDASLPEETLGSGEAEAGDTSGEGTNSNAGDEELEGSLGEEEPLEKLAAAPTATTPEVTPKSGELHPQETKPQYEATTTALTTDKGETANKILMIVKAPTVMDADGETVPATLTVEGNTLTMSLTLSDSSKFPITAAITATGGTPPFIPPEVHYGIADPNPKSFATAEEEPGKTTDGFDKHLETGQLHVKIARDAIPYNANSAQLAELMAWLTAVEKAHLKPYITFETTGNCVSESSKKAAPKETCPADSDPSIPEYTAHIKTIMLEVKEAHHVVTRWGAWNEPDYQSEAKGENEHNPLYRDPKKAALLWKAARLTLKRVGCSCTMVAGEFSENDGYVTKYKNVIKQNHEYWSHLPGAWGLHDYKDLSEVSSKRPDFDDYAKRFTAGLGKNWGHPDIWISEAGVELTNNRARTKLAKAANTLELQRLAAEDFLHLHTISKEYIAVIDYYLYRGPSEAVKKEKPNQFDSALLHGEGVKETQEPREAYCVIALGEKGCPPPTETKATAPDTTTLTATTATLSVDPVGLPTKYFLEYGTTTGYGHTTSPAAVTNENGTQSETVSLAGLEPCTTYHYQAEAENEDDAETPSLGGDKTFTTHGCGPWVKTGPWTYGSGEALYPYIITGEIEPAHEPASYYFEYGPTLENGYSTYPKEIKEESTPITVEAEIFAEREEGGGLGELEEDNRVEGREEEEQLKEEEEGRSSDFAVGLFAHPDVILCFKPWHYRIVGVNATGTRYGAEQRISCI